MTDLKTLEAAVAHLPSGELEKFRVWFEEYIATIWDERIESDLAAGRLDELARAALDDHALGRTKEL